VQIDSVGLTTGLPYVYRSSPAHIKFSLTMEPEEALQSVVWQKEDGESRYEWQASGTVVGQYRNSFYYNSFIIIKVYHLN